ncbi:MAG: response regulator [Oligoflexia bacterium]|nr:response regulator [Oligoflexia bacterium]
MREAPLILVVDDVAVNIKILEVILRKAEFRVISASDGPSGRQLAKQEKPDLILLDVMMPDENGMESCARLKQDPATASIPVIFLSAVTDTATKVQGLTMGGVDYITKPFAREEVLARINIHLKIKSESLAQLQEQDKKISEFRDAQHSILVQEEDLPAAKFSVFYQPLESAGGDFYDVIAHADNSFAYFVGDISGHDLKASFVTSALKALLNQNGLKNRRALDCITSINQNLRSVLSEGQHLTATYIVLNRNTNKMVVVNAGQPGIIFIPIAGDRTPLQLNFGGDVLGAFESANFAVAEMSVAIGDRFYLFTDGLVSNDTSPDLQQGIEKMKLLLAGYRDLPLKQVVQNIAKDLCGSKQEQSDDVLLFGLEV